MHFPFVFPFPFGGRGVGNLSSENLIWLGNVVALCNWLSSGRETGQHVGFSGLDFGEIMIVFEAFEF
jgi:hypothetical protein